MKHVLFWFFYMQTSFAFAEALQLEDVLKSAERYPLLLAIQAEQQQAEGDFMSAAGAFDPTIKNKSVLDPAGYYQNRYVDTSLEIPTTLWGTQLIGGYRLGTGSFPSYDGKNETNHQGEFRGGLSIPLWRNGPIDRRRANIKRATLQKDIAQLNILQQRIETTRVATQRYIDWVAAGLRVRVAQALLDIAQTRDAQLATRIAHGDLSPIERTDNARALKSREGLLYQVERQFQQATIELSLFLRDGNDMPRMATLDEVPETLPIAQPPSGDAFELHLSKAQEQRPEAKRLHAMIEQNQVELRFAKNQFAPGLDLMGMVSQDIGRGSTTRRKTEFELSLMVDIPLFFRVARGRIEAAQASITRAQRQQQFANNRIAADVQDALSAVQTSYARISVAHDEVQLTQELEKAERRKFDLGDSTLLFVNIREQNAAEAKIKEIDATADYHKSQAAYIASIGQTQIP